MATEYSITYKYTGQENYSGSLSVARSKFSVSGNTDKRIGKITKIVYKHYHSSTGNNVTWKLKGRLYFADGSYLDSDTVSTVFESNVKAVTNTFSTNLPIPSIFSGWTRINTIKVNDPGETLYWRALAAAPMTITVYFIEAGHVQYGIDNEWKECEVYYGVDGSWQQVTPYCGADGAWNST